MVQFDSAYGVSIHSGLAIIHSTLGIIVMTLDVDFALIKLIVMQDFETTKNGVPVNFFLVLNLISMVSVLQAMSGTPINPLSISNDNVYKGLKDHSTFEGLMPCDRAQNL